MADDTPSIGLDIVHPKIVEGFIPVPASKEVDVPIVRIDTHGVSATFGGCVPIGVDPVETPPLGVWLAGLEVGLEEAGRGSLCEKCLCVVPVPVENEGGMQRRHDGMLELDLRTGKDGVVGRQEPSFAEMLEDLSKDDRFAVLHVMGCVHEKISRIIRIRNLPRHNALVYAPHTKAP